MGTSYRFSHGMLGRRAEVEVEGEGDLSDLAQGILARRGGKEDSRDLEKDAILSWTT